MLYVGHKTVRFSFSKMVRCEPPKILLMAVNLLHRFFLQLHFYIGRVGVLVDFCVAAASKLFFVCAIIDTAPDCPAGFQYMYVYPRISNPTPPFKSIRALSGTYKVTMKWVCIS